MTAKFIYARIREVELPHLAGGRHHYAELRFNPVRGAVTDCCVGYKVWYASEYAEIVRYDSAHGYFHRHAAGYPEPGPEDKRFYSVPMNFRGRIAVADIRENCESWQHVLPVERKEQAAK